MMSAAALKEFYDCWELREEVRPKLEEERKSWNKDNPKPLRSVRLPPRRIASKTGRR